MDDDRDSWPPPYPPVPIGAPPPTWVFGPDGERYNLNADAQVPAVHPGAWGWKNTSVPDARTPHRPVDRNFDHGCTIAMWPEQSMIGVAELLMSKQSASYPRRIFVPPWGIALPVTAGAIRVTVQLVANKAVTPVTTPVNINGSVSAGWTFEEEYSDQTIQAQGPSGNIEPPMFARTLKLVVLGGPGITAIDGNPLVLTAGQSLELPAGQCLATPGAEFALPHAFTTSLSAVSTIGLIWKIVGP